jgi:hypothetical protein
MPAPVISVEAAPPPLVSLGTLRAEVASAGTAANGTAQGSASDQGTINWLNLFAGQGGGTSSRTRLLGSLNRLAGIEHASTAPIDVIPAPTPADEQIFSLLESVGSALEKEPVLGPGPVIFQRLLQSAASGQETSFLATFPLITSTSSDPTVLKQVDAISLEGKLIPLGFDVSTGVPRPAFMVDFQTPGDQPPGPALTNALHQFAQEPIADIRIVPKSSELGNETFFADLARTTGAGLGLDALVIPDLALQPGAVEPGPVAGLLGLDQVGSTAVPPGSGLFPLTLTTDGLNLLPQGGGISTMAVFDEDGQVIATNTSADGLTLPDLPPGNYFVSDLPAAEEVLPPAATQGPALAEEDLAPAAAALLPATSAVTGPLVPVFTRFATDVNLEEEEFHVLPDEAAADRFLLELGTPFRGAPEDGSGAGGTLGSEVWNALQRALPDGQRAATGPPAPGSILTGYPISVEFMNGSTGPLVAPPAVTPGGLSAPGFHRTAQPDALFQPTREEVLSPLPAQPEIAGMPPPAPAAPAEVRPLAVEGPQGEAPPAASEGHAADVRGPADEALSVPTGDRQEEDSWARFVGAIVFAAAAHYPRPPAPDGNSGSASESSSHSRCGPDPAGIHERRRRFVCRRLKKAAWARLAVPFCNTASRRAPSWSRSAWR